MGRSFGKESVYRSYSGGLCPGKDANMISSYTYFGTLVGPSGTLVDEELVFLGKTRKDEDGEWETTVAS